MDAVAYQFPLGFNYFNYGQESVFSRLQNGDYVFNDGCDVGVIKDRLWAQCRHMMGRYRDDWRQCRSCGGRCSCGLLYRETFGADDFASFRPQLVEDDNFAAHNHRIPVAVVSADIQRDSVVDSKNDLNFHSDDLDQFERMAVDFVQRGNDVVDYLDNDCVVRITRDPQVDVCRTTLRVTLLGGLVDLLNRDEDFLNNVDDTHLLAE